MNKVTAKIIHELRALLPVTIYFLFVTELLALTNYTLLGEYGIDVFAFFKAIVISLVIAKVVLIMDLMPLMRIFNDRPLFFGTLWSTVVYFSAALLLQVVEGVAHPLIQSGDIASAIQHFVTETAWPRFWLVQFWIFALLFNYCLIREVSKVLGPGKLFALFFRDRGVEFTRKS